MTKKFLAVALLAAFTCFVVPSRAAADETKQKETKQKEEQPKAQQAKKECSLQREPRNEGKETWYRCIKDTKDTCTKSCQLWSKKKDSGDTEKVADPDTWVKGDPRTYNYYCLCK